MYGLKQAGSLTTQLLKKVLTPFVYYPTHHTPGLWLQKTRPIAFSLILDDFALTYAGKQHADHLRNALLRSYEFTTDWEGKVYSVMTLQWDYKNTTCDIYMPGYVAHVLSKFQHDKPKHPQDTPSRYVMPVYGAKTVYATQDETSPLTEKQCLNIQKVTGYILYYARSVDPTVLVPLNSIATEQKKATEKTQVAINQLLDYLDNSSRRHHQISCIRYDSSYSQRCIISFRFICAHPSRWPTYLW
jgi:hypothetical protein